MIRITASLALSGTLSLLLTGCIAKTALDVVTLPVRAAGSAVDATTTSQSESDEKRGRALRKQEERLGRLEREHRELQQDCAQGDNSACREMGRIESEIDAVLASERGQPRS